MKDIMKVSEMESNTSWALSSLLVKATGSNQKGICLMDEFYPSNGYKHLKNENIDPFPKFFHPSNENGCYERFGEGREGTTSCGRFLAHESRVSVTAELPRSLLCIYNRKKNARFISVDVQIQNGLEISSVISLVLFSWTPLAPIQGKNKNIFGCLLLWTRVYSC